MKLENPDLLAFAREANDDLSHYLTGDQEAMPADWIGKWEGRLADALYASQAHWHRVDGRCINDIPFEVHMQALAAFAHLWVKDIYERKARDRKRPAMLERLQAWETLLADACVHIQTDVRGNVDERAEREFQEKVRPPGRLRHWWNSRMWGH